MKKGVVMEVAKRHMIVLTKDGQFIRAKSESNVDIGEEVTYSPLPTYQFLTFFEKKMYSVPLASILAILLIFPISSFFQATTVYGVVSLDMNPSVELSVNDQYEVVSTVGYNEKGKSLLSDIDTSLEGMGLLNAASELLKEGHNQGMINETNSIYLSSALSFYDEVNFESWSLSILDEYNFDVYSIFVKDSVVKEAQELSISPAKLLLQSKSEIESFDSKELSNTPIHEIEKALDQSFDQNKDVKNELKDSLEDEPVERKKGDMEDAEGENLGLLNPAGKQAHPHKQTHPGKGKGHSKEKNINSAEQSKEKNINSAVQSKEKSINSAEQSNKNKGNKYKKSSISKNEGKASSNNGKGKAKGKPDHAGGGKSDSKQNGPRN